MCVKEVLRYTVPDRPQLIDPKEKCRSGRSSTLGPTHLPINDFCNIVARRCIPVNDVTPAFQGVCDTDTMKRLASFVGGSFRSTLRRRALRRKRGDQPWSMVPSTSTRKKVRCVF